MLDKSHFSFYIITKVIEWGGEGVQQHRAHHRRMGVSFEA